ncbi:MAG TPA: ABC transporter permease, partial [Alphaproteobacteria bacterium]|nr:ABC transporter permease [Alphaproteobacteria bacterium]
MEATHSPSQNLPKAFQDGRPTLRSWAEQIAQDLRYCIRGLVKSPGYSAIVLITLALGIGANTAIFSVVNGVMLKPLPFSEPDRLYVFYESTPATRQYSISYPNFLDWQSGNKSFSSIAAFRRDNLVLTGEGRPERLHAAMISAGLLSTLGVRPALGREFESREDHLGSGGVVLISESLWRNRYSSDPDVLGRTLQLSGAAYSIVGGVPDAVQALKVRLGPADIFVPVGQWRDPSFHDRKVTTGLYAVGRLKPGISESSARAELTNLAANLAKAYPDANRDVGITIVPLKKVV